VDAKRKKVEELIYGVFDRLDKSGKNTAYYKELFKGMSDQSFHAMMKKFLKDKDENFYLEIVPFENEPTLPDIKSAANFINVPLEEYVYLPFESPDKDDPIRTAVKVPVGYLHIKRLEQMLQKKNTYSLDNTSRNMKSGSVTGGDKNSRVSDVEAMGLVTLGADEALKEFMGPRADDVSMRTEMTQQIFKDGFVSQKDLKSDTKNKQALNTLVISHCSVSKKKKKKILSLFQPSEVKP